MSMSTKISRIIPHGPWVRLLAAIALIPITATVSIAARPSTAELERIRQVELARRDAYTLSVSGNYEQAIAVLTAAYQQLGGKRSVELAIASSLASFSFQLRNGGNISRANDLAVLAVARLSQAEGKMTRAEAAEAFSLAGDVSRLVSGKGAEARQYYERAVSYGADVKKLSAKIETLSAVERIAVDKVRGNEVLKQRSR